MILNCLLSNSRSSGLVSHIVVVSGQVLDKVITVGYFTSEIKNIMQIGRWLFSWLKYLKSDLYMHTNIYNNLNSLKNKPCTYSYKQLHHKKMVSEGCIFADLCWVL